MESLTCPAGCGKVFGTSQARNSHITQAVSCSWYRTYEKTAALENILRSSLTVVHNELGDEYMQREAEGDAVSGAVSSDEAGEALREFEEDNDIFHFVPLDRQLEIGEPGPGPSTQAFQQRLLERQLGAKVQVLDDEETQRVEEEHPTGGVCIRMDASLHTRWREIHNLPPEDELNHSEDPPNNPLPLPINPSTSPSLRDQMFSPFASEMDWRIAEWVVKDSIGHKSFDRLLSIPGVVEKLGLSYKNVAGLHKAVDSIRPRAGEWKVRRLRFKDRPDEAFILRYRDILEAVKSLWGDPALAKHLVYRPKKVFQDAEKEKRCYSEMWTGKWWQYTQVHS
ncbi:hypothetical protein BT96DRAFT_1070394 [Gymnopus androsaceus JB14]|uniref:Uncharacterized protein n=1 Tax=Gymnopus androsaceus JB14 TaxID=1447944 RepID=A0A6A4GUE6_9AGAR|nr:hypothetical protein BT96DRAFT_1070394 [Gymnopus androsaceus JB14]